MLFFPAFAGLHLCVGTDGFVCIAGNCLSCKNSKDYYSNKSYDCCHVFILHINLMTASAVRFVLIVIFINLSNLLYLSDVTGSRGREPVRTASGPTDPLRSGNSSTRRSSMPCIFGISSDCQRHIRATDFARFRRHLFQT